MKRLIATKLPFLSWEEYINDSNTNLKKDIYNLCDHEDVIIDAKVSPGRISYDYYEPDEPAEITKWDIDWGIFNKENLKKYFNIDQEYDNLEDIITETYWDKIEEIIEQYVEDHYDDIVDKFYPADDFDPNMPIDDLWNQI